MEEKKNWFTVSTSKFYTILPFFPSALRACYFFSPFASLPTDLLASSLV
jgi:hypothetical protein